MVVINAERCTGCGACVEVCPAAALYLVDGRVALDSTLCRDCESCIAACPTGAISLPDRAQAAASARALQPRTDPGLVTVRSAPGGVPLGARVLPFVGATLGWVAREIVPRLADYWLDSLNRRPADRLIGGDGPVGRPGGCPQGGRRRHRRRQAGRSE